MITLNKWGSSIFSFKEVLKSPLMKYSLGITKHSYDLRSKESLGPLNTSILRRWGKLRKRVCGAKRF